MPVLRNPKHEAFAQGMAKGLSAYDAYAAAGYKPDRGSASRMSANASIEARIANILNNVATKAEWTAADRLLSLKAIHDASLTEDRRTAIAAIAEANKMQGSHAPAKVQHAGHGGGPVKIDISGMSREQIGAAIENLSHLASLTDDADQDDAGGTGEA